MADFNQAIRASTQEHLDIHTIKEHLVILKDGSAAMLLQTSAINFGLLSEEEQDAAIYGYASLLNSLSFPVQILLRSVRKDITDYLEYIDQQIDKTRSQKIKEQIVKYRAFIKSLVKDNKVLEKKFYLVIPYSTFEMGLQASNFNPFARPPQKPAYDDAYILNKAKLVLYPRRDHLIRQLARVGLQARQLNTQELVSLFYRVYNPTATALPPLTPPEDCRSPPSNMLNFFAKPKSAIAPPTAGLPPIVPKSNTLPDQQINRSTDQLAAGLTNIQDIIAPPSIEVDFTHLKIGNTYFRTLFVAGYPRYVSANWLSPLINFDHSIDVSMFIYPVDVKGTLEQLRRRIAEMEAEISADIERGRIPQASTQAQLEDAQGLQEQLVKGIERFFQFSLYITITADTQKELDTITKQVQSLLGSLIIVSKVASLSQEDAFKSTLPYCKDKLLITRNMDTTALSTTFPFTSSELTDNQGVLYGINEHNESLVIFDRFSLENANLLVLATSGAGKSYSVKLEILRSIMFGTEVIVIDPENEYEMLTRTVGGNFIAFSVTSAHKVNPFQLPDVTKSSEDELSNKFLFLSSLLKIMMGQLDPTEDAILNRALVLAYQYRNISADPTTHHNPPPRLEDLYKALVGMEEPQAMGLAARLEKYVKGSLKGIFDQDSNIEISSAMTVFTLRELADEIRPIVMFIILDYIWNKIQKDLKRRLLVVDEAWYLMRFEDSAKVLQGFVKRARKYYLGVTIISQNADDLGSPYGKAIVTNSALQFLMKQSSAAIDDVAQVFYLSQGERHLLLSANVGEGLFFAGQNHVALRVVSSPDEHALVTSKPQEILARQEADRAAAQGHSPELAERIE